MLVKVVLAAGYDLGPVDGDKSIAVLAALFVPQSYSMANFVDRATGRTACGKSDELLAALAAYPGAAAVAGDVEEHRAAAARDGGEAARLREEERRELPGHSRAHQQGKHCLIGLNPLNAG